MAASDRTHRTNDHLLISILKIFESDMPMDKQTPWSVDKINPKECKVAQALKTAALQIEKSPKKAIELTTPQISWLYRIAAVRTAIEASYSTCSAVNNALDKIIKQEALTISGIEATTAKLARQIKPDGIKKELKELEDKFATFEAHLHRAELTETVATEKESKALSDALAALNKPREDIQKELQDVVEDTGVLIRHLHQLEQDEQSYIDLKAQLAELLEELSAAEKSAVVRLNIILREVLEAKYETESERRINQEIVLRAIKHKDEFAVFLHDVKDTQIKVECALLKHKKALQDVFEKHVEPVHQLTAADSLPSPIIQRFLQSVMQLGEAKQAAADAKESDAKTVTTRSHTFDPLGIQITRNAIRPMQDQVMDIMPRRLCFAKAQVEELKLPAPQSSILKWGLIGSGLGLTSYAVLIFALGSIVSAFSAGAMAALILGVVGIYLAYRCLKHAGGFLDEKRILLQSGSKSRAMQHQFDQQDKELQKLGFSQEERLSVIKKGVLIHSLNRTFFENRRYAVNTHLSADEQPCSVVEPAYYGRSVVSVLSEKRAVYKLKTKALLFKPASDVQSVADKKPEKESSLRPQLA